MKRFAAWWRDHWYLFALVLAALGAILFFRNRRASDIVAQLKTEQDAIAAAKRIRKLEADHGRETAIREAEDQFQEAQRIMNADEIAEAKTLRDDPAELSKFLVRVGRQ